MVPLTVVDVKPLVRFGLLKLAIDEIGHSSHTSLQRKTYIHIILTLPTLNIYVLAIRK